MHSRKLALATLAVLTGLTLTACQSDDGGDDKAAPAGNTAADSSASADEQGSAEPSASTGSGDSSSSAGSGSSSGSSGSSDSAGSSGSSGGGASAKTGKCLTSNLKISASDATIGDDDPATVAITFENTGSASCSLNAYAGADLSTNAGSLSAERGIKASVPDHPVVLKPGEKTYAPVLYPVNKTGGSGVRITGLTVTPPDETHSVKLSWPGQPSLPVSDSDKGQAVVIGPMGSIGQGEG
ncbi:DUF4232 domain-containing protein [Streptomyces sp. DSM 41982]|uniref:DUF4232 domain-containing protein n=1 Tax=Streptomyces evansiae TaxID=3075535 RepID=A0ABD5E7E0_9ACTN|nr:MULTISPECIES: DUF4232 domain-containing protein [unclassified Streptomyces]MDT0416936.1 DUF4232 domain-containing protein [Streptomyces sp. DSM 41982]SCE13845.1 Protein of unknown function [Streptomyces sp. SolWspMP-sol7th]